MSAAVSVTYYLEVLSSWCHWAEPAWTELKQRYAGRVDFHWRIALMNPADFPVSAAQCDWFYQRSGVHVGSPRKLNSGWFETARAGRYEVADYVAEAGRDFLGNDDDSLRLALSHAAMIAGRKIGDIAVATAVAAEATGLDATDLRAAAESSAVRARVELSTAEFFRHQLNQRPSFIVTNSIGDKVVLSGTWRAAPIVAAIDSLLEDAARYTSHAAHFGSAPGS
ncbi:disulfide bond formation protein DsbA [Synoicihabitans lomoniglobus]|uniref:Disulfide bond formation protein DsbA n=1 Tax=Synoicihabitans lomoniglobus TaxID=2909285 RepID=A0AAF0CHZ4_9BACT|nr:DsbA family protein [Opitutaceae bacterium LMO-M01]WED64817.1 disulfide bond formation protein DsbA [Opitutaceae bacterium LMO-M01]